MRPDIVVVGGGIVGCCVALELATRHRVKVVVLERAIPGAEASSAAAGILGAQVEAHELDGASFDRDLFSFMIAARARHAALDVELVERVGFGTGYRPAGALKTTMGDAAALHAKYAFQKALARVAFLDGAEARQLEPALSAEVQGAVHFPDDGQVDPPLLLRALHQACVASGVELRGGAMVRGVRVEGQRARGVDLVDGVLETDRVVVAAGSWSSLVGNLPTGLRQVHPVRGQIVQVETRPPIVRGVVMGDRGYVLARADGRTVLGSTMEEVGHVKEVTAGGVHQVLTQALALLPALASAPISGTWSGFRPAAPRPILGATFVEGLYVATGHHRNGVLLAPESGRLLADLVVTGRCDRDLSAFSPIE